MTEDGELIVLAEQAQQKEIIPVTIENLKAEIQKNLNKSEIK